MYTSPGTGKSNNRRLIEYLKKATRSATHGTRTCIKRKKIAHGNFFDFRLLKRIWKWVPRDQNRGLRGF